VEKSCDNARTLRAIGAAYGTYATAYRVPLAIESTVLARTGRSVLFQATQEAPVEQPLETLANVITEARTLRGA
jgi:hypothetical protein